MIQVLLSLFMFDVVLLLCLDNQGAEVQPVCRLVVIWHPDVRDVGGTESVQWM